MRETTEKRLLNKSGLAEEALNLSLLWNLFTIRQKPQKPSFWEVIGFLGFFLAKARLADSRNSFHRLPACLIQPIYFIGTAKKSDFDMQLHSQRLQKTFEMNEAWTERTMQTQFKYIHPCNVYFRIKIATQISLWII